MGFERKDELQDSNNIGTSVAEVDEERRRKKEKKETKRERKEQRGSDGKVIEDLPQDTSLPDGWERFVRIGGREDNRESASINGLYTFSGESHDDTPVYLRQFPGEG